MECGAPWRRVAMSITFPVPERLRLVQPDDPAATLELGRRIGERLGAGDVVALVGEIGAGKTTLTQGLALGLGVDEPEAVASPTYLLAVEHPGAPPLLHADAYLPAKLEGFLADGGLLYLFGPDRVSVVEWADRIPSRMPPDARWIELCAAPDGGRTCRLGCARAESFPWTAQLGHNPDSC